MKLFLLVTGLFFFNNHEPSLLILDKNLKKPIQSATSFTPEQYMQSCFPVYEKDVEAIIQAADMVVKRMENVSCHAVDTITAAHTRLLLISDCETIQTFSIVLITDITEGNTAFGYTLVAKEENRRKAQQKLLDFATYLAR